MGEISCIVSLPGSCDGMTYEEIEATYPAEFERRKTVRNVFVLRELESVINKEMLLF